MDDLNLLEHFILDNPELEQLESLANPFNIFEAIGVVGQELRHSDFLAYLLSPNQNHGLGDKVARRLLQKTIANSDNTSIPINVVELETWDLNHLEVLREWNSIDILLKDDTNKFVVAIENKIGSTEHSGQLERYWQALSSQFPLWRKMGMYLTPDGEAASHSGYLPIDYGLVATVLDTLLPGPAFLFEPGCRNNNHSLHPNVEEAHRE